MAPHARILLVEDIDIIALDMQNRLASLGYETAARAVSGEEAIAKTAETRPDLALMNVTLRGEMDGIQAGLKIREQFDIPVVYMTAHTDNVTIQRAALAGPYGYLLKPVSDQQLAATIEMALRVCELRQQRESEDRFHLAFERAAAGMCLVDLSGRFLKVNHQLCAMLGYSQRDLESMHVDDITHPDYRETSAAIAQMITGKMDQSGAEKQNARRAGQFELFPPEELERVSGAARTVEAGWGRSIDYVLLRQDGSCFPAELSVSAIPNDAGAPAAFVAVVRDITARRSVEQASKQAENLLRASEEQLRVIFDHANDGIHVANAADEILQVNPRMCEMMGYSREELLEMRVWELQAPEVRGRAGSVVTGELARHGSAVFGGVNLHRSGRRIPVEISVARIARPQGDWYVSIVRDITERLAAEQASRQAEAVLQRRTRQLAILNEIGSKIAAVLKLEDVLERATFLAQSELGYHHAAIFTVDPQRGDLVMRARAGQFVHLFPPEHRIWPEKGMVGWSYRQGERALSNDVDADPRYVNFYPDVIPTQSELCAPVKAHGEVVGVLDVQSPQRDAFDENDAMAIEVMADQIATAMENARLLEQARRDAQTNAELLREVNHRVGNNLSTLISIIRLEQARAAHEQADYRDIVQDMDHRIRGLAKLHQMLQETNWAGLELSQLTKQIIRLTLDMVPPDKPVTLEVTPSDVQVNAKQAHKLALIINELATNTLKYAVSRRPSVRIAVRIEKIAQAGRGVPQEAGNTREVFVLFEYRDDGPGYPEEVLRREHSNVGLDLIRVMVSADLGGSLTLSNDPAQPAAGGAVTAIRFKAYRELGSGGR